MAKPTGTIGHVSVTSGPEGTRGHAFKQIEFPKDKSEIEELIASRFVKQIASTPAPGGQVLTMDNLARNCESDFDFTVMTSAGQAYLELMEAAPLEGPYEQAPGGYRPYEYAKNVLATIGEKAVRYPKAGVKPIYLLVYITHWAFRLSDSAVNCLRYWLVSLPTPFTGIFLYAPHESSDGYIEWLYPSEVPK